MLLPSFLPPTLAVGLVLLSALASPAAQAASLSLDLSTVCVHNKAAARRHLNQVNPGLGLEYPLSRNIGLAGGFYRNSFERTSAYALIDWTPMHLRLPAGLSASMGIAGGLVSGYAHVNPVAPFAAAALIKIRGARRWGINLVAVPNVSASSGFIGLQLVVPL
ncbi:hypothetical protein [Thiomonas sp.]